MNEFALKNFAKTLFSDENRKPTVILLFASLAITTLVYYGSKTFYLSQLSSKLVLFNDSLLTAEWYTYGFAFLLLGVGSLAIIKLVFREPVSSYGLCLGDWKFWIPASLIVGSVFVVLSYVSSRDPQFIAVYPLYKGAGASYQTFLIHAVAYMFFYFGWEMFFRGFMQHGLKDSYGAWGAILVQVSLSCIAHIGKPGAEIYSSIPGAIIWGWLVFRSRSIWPAFITHMILGVSLDFFISFT